jgi:hypothetical protein
MSICFNNSIVAMLYCCFVVLSSSCIAVLMYCHIVVMLYCCFVALSCLCTVTLMYCYIVVMLYCCFVVLLYWCIIVLMYCCIVVLVCIVIHDNLSEHHQGTFNTTAAQCRSNFFIHHREHSKQQMLMKIQNKKLLQMMEFSNILIFEVKI